MDPGLQKILDFLNRERTRATYGAVGEALGIPGRAVGSMLGERRPDGSWIVNAESGDPTGYEPHQKHPALYEESRVIKDGMELLRRMAGIEARDWTS